MHPSTRWSTTLCAALTLLAACDNPNTPNASAPDLPAALLSPPTGRIAFYPFDKAGENGTPNGALRYGTGGYEGGGYSFDGVDDYVNLPVNVNPSVHPQVTMGAWVKVSSLPTDSTPVQVLSHDNGYFDRSLALDVRGASDGKYHVSAFTGNGVLAGAVVDTAVWTFVATVYTDSTVTLYVNGQTPVTAAASTGAGVDSLRLGGNPAGDPYSGEPFHGWIDNVFVFDRALSATEIAGIRADGACALTGTCVYPRPVAFYPFDTTTGNGGVHEALYSTDHNGSYSFDGVNDYIDLPVNVNPSVRPQATIGGWFKVASLPTDSTPAQVLSHDNGYFDRSIALDMRGAADGKYHVSAFTGTGVLAGAVVDTTDWTFVAAVYTDSTVTLYVDGHSPVTAAASTGAGVDSLRVGGNPAGNPFSGEPFHGGIDNVFVYDRALSATEVAQIRAGGVCAIAGLRCTITQ